MSLMRYNERSWAIDVISEARLLLSRTRRIIGRAGGESTISSEEGSLFPDVILYEGSSGATILQGWELKMPDTPITDSALIENAREKAKKLRLNSFVIWNANTAVLYLSTDLQNYTPFHVWPSLPSITKREHVQPNKTEWVGLLTKILDDLQSLFEKGTLEGRNFIKDFSDISIIPALLENSGGVATEIQSKSVSDAIFAAEVNIWWANVKSEYLQEKDPYTVLAKRVILNWINRFLFAHAIKTRFAKATEVEKITYVVSVRDACLIFESISKDCDFWTVFQPFLGENCLSNSFWQQVTQLNAFLSEIRFSELDQNLLRTFLETSVVSYQRKLAGQFTTPSALADILVRLTLIDRNAPILDPFCGTGTIARAAYNVKVESGLDPVVAHEGVWASDKFPFPLQIASIALSPPECMGMLLHVFKADALSLTSGQILGFIDPNDGTRRTEALPSFRFIASNLPFVQQEDLNVANPGLAKINSFILEKTGTIDQLDARSDLFAYLPFYLWRILSDDGRLGAILSNSWLATEWGATFRNLLQRFFHIEKVIVSGAGRWFRNCDVVTTILVLNKRAVVSSPSTNEITSFVRLDLPIQESLNASETKTIAEHMLLGKDIPSVLVTRAYSQDRIVELEGLGMNWSSLFAGLEWLKRIKDQLVKVSSLFEINRGMRRGWDPMFYPAKSHSIEANYLKPFLKSSRSVEGLIASPDGEAFCCNKNLTELRSLGHKGTVRWINRFAHATNEKGKPLPKVLKIPGMEWYQMNASTLADLVMLINYDKRLFVAKMSQQSFVNQRLTRLTVRSQEVDVPLCHAILNSIIGVFYIEALGFGRGLGVLDLNTSKMRENLFMLNPALVSVASREAILTDFDPLLKRPVAPILEELTREERRRFDETVLASFGLQNEYDHIVGAFMTLYNIRKAVDR